MLIFVTGEVIVRVFFKPSTTDRTEFLTQAWNWPLDRADQFQGPLMSAHVPHPFWGFHLNPQMKGINNLGFDNPDDYPYERKSNEVIVGVFGGSVAEHAAPFLRAAFAKAENALVQKCKREVKLLNFAQGAFRQPSQFHIFSFFLEKIDIAINIDGFNDLFFTPSARFPASYPVFTDELFYITSEKYQKLSLSYRFGQWQHALLKPLVENHTLARSDLAFEMIKKIFYILENKKAKSLEEARTIGIKGAADEFEQSSQPQNLIATWKKYILFQDILSLKNTKKSFFFLQPSQYAENSKIFSPEEKKIAFVTEPGELLNRQQGILQLQEATENLAKKGVAIYDYSRLFSGVSDPVFIDDCCHLNQKGNQLLSDAIVKVLLPYMSRQYCYGNGGS